ESQGVRRERRGLVLPRRGATEAGRGAALPRDPRPELRDGRVRGHPGVLERGTRDAPGPQAARALRAVREELPDAPRGPAAHRRRAVRHNPGDPQAQRPAPGHLHPAFGLQGRHLGRGEPAGRVAALHLHGSDGQLRGIDGPQVLRRLVAAHAGHLDPGPGQADGLLHKHGARGGRGAPVRLRRRHLPHPGRPRLRGERRQHLPGPQGADHHAAGHGGHPGGHHARRGHGARREGDGDARHRTRRGPHGALRGRRGVSLRHGVPDSARHGGGRPRNRNGQHRARRRAFAGAVLQGGPRRLGRVHGLDRRRRGCGGGAAV
ncbi:MAG: Branched-chain amino acid aminotransferase, partial [uncultured Rubrobacteraceae bacterium]